MTKVELVNEYELICRNIGKKKLNSFFISLRYADYIKLTDNVVVDTIGLGELDVVNLQKEVDSARKVLDISNNTYSIFKYFIPGNKVDINSH